MSEYKKIQYRYTPEEKKEHWEVGLGLQEVDGIKPFKNNAKYFRDALVRANFSDVQHNVSRDNTYLNRFLENAVYHGNHKLRSEDMVVPELF